MRNVQPANPNTIREEGLPNRSCSRTVHQPIIEIIRKLSEQSSIEGIGISIPGLVTPATGKVIFVPYFKWLDVPIGELISRSTGLPVTIDNDANAVALAELWFGRPEG